MENVVYVDVLLVLNYIINLLLILCTAKLSGRVPKRRRIVVAALVGSLCSLTIFLPLSGFFPALLLRIFCSLLIVRIAFPYIGAWELGKLWLLFFVCNFFFAGFMLGIWLVFKPNGMTYYNGIIYIHISSFTLLITTIAAYILLGIGNRLARAGRPATAIYNVKIHYAGKTATVRGLVDSGNSLYEPFSDTPVTVCCLEDVAELFPSHTVQMLRKGAYLGKDSDKLGVKLRLIPYSGVGNEGMLPAFRADYLILLKDEQKIRVENAYIALSQKRLGNSRYNAILSPDLVGLRYAPKNLHCLKQNGL